MAEAIQSELGAVQQTLTEQATTPRTTRKRPRGRPRKKAPSPSASSTNSASDEQPLEAPPRVRSGRPAGRDVLQYISQQISGQLLLIGTPLLMAGRTTTGTLIIMRAEYTGDLWARACRGNPTLLEWTLRFLKVSVFAEVGDLGLQVAVASAVDSERIAPDHPMTFRIRDAIDYAQQQKAAEALARQQQQQAPAA